MDTNVLYEVVEKAKKYDELLKIQREFTLNCELDLPSNVISPNYYYIKNN